VKWDRIDLDQTAQSDVGAASSLEPEEQEVLELPFKCSRDLRKAYALREKPTQIFDTKQSPETAQSAIREWIAEIQRSGLDCFDKFIVKPRLEHI
jgi:hypothetical protein